MTQSESRDNSKETINDYHSVNSSTGFFSGEDTVDLMRYLRIMFLNKWKFLIIFFSVLLLAFLYANKLAPVYEAKYEIFYNESEKEYILEKGTPVQKSKFNPVFWVKTMNSDELMRRTVEVSGLAIKPQSLKKMMSAEIVEDSKSKKSDVYFLLSISSGNPDLFPILANAYVEALNGIVNQLSEDNNHNLIDYLEKQLADKKNKLQQIDNKILEGISKNPDITRSAESLSQDLESFRVELLNRRIDLAAVAASRRQAENELGHLDGTIVNESAFSEPLKVQLMNLQVDLARALTKKKEDHPSVIAIRENIRQIRNMLRDSIEQKLEIKSLARNPLKGELMGKLIDLQIQEVSLQTRIMGLEGLILELETKLVPDSLDENKMRLVRNREFISESITMLNGRLLEAQSKTYGGLSRFLMIDEPKAPLTPSSKGMKFYLTVGLLLALILAAGFVFLYDLLDNRLRLTEDFEKLFPYIPILARVHQKKDIHKVVKKKMSRTEYYSKHHRELAELILSIRKENKKFGKKVFSIVSPLQQEGKSTISYMLSKNLAENNYKTLVVDLDFFNPITTKKANEKIEYSLNDYLNGNATFGEVINTTDTDNLYVIGAHRKKEGSLCFYDDPKMAELVQKMKDNFDIIIFDTPAILFIPDVISAFEYTDALIPVFRLGVSSRVAVEKTMKMLKDDRKKILGAIINGVVKTKLDYYYSDEYYYKYGERRKKVSPGISMFM